MKKANLKKVLFLPVIVGGLLLTLNPSNVEANQNRNAMIDIYNTIVQPQARILAVSNGVTTPSIQQTGITVVAGRKRTISSDIANYRTYYGEGEEVEIQIKFTKPIKGFNNSKLVIKFGEDGNEKVISNATQSKDILTFKYAIAAEDNGGLILQNLTGTVSDEENNSCDLAIPVGLNNTYSNTIIAKGNSEQYSGSDYREGKEQVLKGQQIQFEENIYILDNEQIRKIKKSDVFYLNVMNGESETFDEDTIDSELLIGDNYIKWERRRTSEYNNLY